MRVRWTRKEQDAVRVSQYNPERRISKDLLTHTSGLPVLYQRARNSHGTLLRLQRRGGVHINLLHAAGGMYPTARDLHRFSVALDPKRFPDLNDHRLMFTPQVVEAPESERSRDWAMGWHVDERSVTPDHGLVTIVERGGEGMSFETLLPRPATRSLGKPMGPRHLLPPVSRDLRGLRRPNPFLHRRCGQRMP